MATISTADKFLGSLVGAYVGTYDDREHSEQAEQAPRQWAPVSSSPLYQAWLANIQQQQLPVPSHGETSLAIALPWLLAHHDDSRHRHHGLTQTLTSPTISHESTLIKRGGSNLTDATGSSDTIGALYLMGDCLEWLMQCSPHHPSPHLQLCQHLQQQHSTYPKDIRPQVNWCIQVLAAQSSDITDSLRPQEQPWRTLIVALRCCLQYRENMALAFTSPDIIAPGSPIPSIAGCFLGAWRGLSAIPTAWLMTLTQDARQSLTDMAEHLYRHWAGISNLAANFEAFPLDL